MAKRIKILFVEPSQIVAAGFRDIVCVNNEFELLHLSDLTHCGDKITMTGPDLVIINPCVCGMGRRGSLRANIPQLQNMILGSFSYTPQPEECMRQFDFHIGIFDDQQTVMKKLRSANENEAETAEPVSGNELSDREKEILVSVAGGLTNKEIADRHNISIHTVISHRKNITRKTGIKTVSGLTIYAMLNGLIDISDLE